MSLETTYQPAQIEDKWYAYWLEHKLFAARPNPDKEPYSIVIPPPNVTGVLHMGHMLNNTLQDVLIRRARMRGYEACWVPGTDHASIATEAKVVALLKEQGLSKESLGREAFLEHAFAWKEKYGGIILEQLKKLGASCDWDRTRFTMEPELYQSVVDVFVDLYDKGRIYRGIRMVNWDPQGRTALSDDEVLHKEVERKMYYVRYRFAEGEGFLTVATVRPETIMADVAVAVHPTDERYAGLIGRKVLIPLIDKPIPIIADDYVDPAFGTGCLKVTPAHDPNDYAIGMRHGLEVIDLLNEDGTLNEQAQIHVGEDRFAARKSIALELEASGLLEKTESVRSSVGFSERTDAVVEPRLSTQWFLKIGDLVPPALERVLDDTIQLHPPKFKNMYRVWMENVRDWCISRQLWWGHRIPAWHGPDGRVVVARNEAEARSRWQAEYGPLDGPLVQDPDVLDTWFSSWLWPISVFDPQVFRTGKPNETLRYFYPTRDLITAPEILFFWVARMVMAGYEYLDEAPFKNVYLTGIVRDKLGRKMSKSLGNSPDPLQLIEQFGADGVRTGMLFSSPAGNDLLYDEKLVEQGRNFANKVWNAFRLVDGWPSATVEVGQAELEAMAWFEARMAQGLSEIDRCFEEYRLADALMAVYKLVWDDFCAWYLEAVKPPFGAPIAASVLEHTRHFFEVLLRIMHPFMPFLTEELWHRIGSRAAGESICTSPWPVLGSFNPELIARFETDRAIVVGVRALRNEKNLSPKESLRLFHSPGADFDRGLVTKMAHVSEPEATDTAPEQSASFRVGQHEFYVPLSGLIDPEAEIKKLKSEKDYLEGFKRSVQAKLQNERFVGSAPAEVVQRERDKLADADSKISAIDALVHALEASK
ncbi:valine--tRNA ligase [bacterium]|nr:valine--tRNA ligase [bacterium]